MNKKILLIKNPISGKKISNIILPKVISKLENIFHLEVIESEFKGHIEKILHSINIKKYDCCCVLGGDGSFHEAINGLMKRDDGMSVPLGLIAAGSGNSLARDLNIIDLNLAIQNLIKFNTSYLDIVKITNDKEDIYSFNIVGWGMVATVGQKAEKYRWLGTNRYTILSLFEIFFKKTNKAIIEYTDINNEKHIIKGEYMFAAICNTIHTGKGMKIAPNSKLNDGLLDLVLIKDATRFKLIKLMSKLFSGRHIYDNIVEYVQITKLKLNAENKSLLIDGEIKGFAPFDLSVIPNKVKIIN